MTIVEHRRELCSRGLRDGDEVAGLSVHAVALVTSPVPVGSGENWPRTLNIAVD